MEYRNGPNFIHSLHISLHWPILAMPVYCLLATSTYYLTSWETKRSSKCGKFTIWRQFTAWASDSSSVCFLSLQTNRCLTNCDFSVCINIMIVFSCQIIVWMIFSRSNQNGLTYKQDVSSCWLDFCEMLCNCLLQRAADFDDALTFFIFSSKYVRCV